MTVFQKLNVPAGNPNQDLNQLTEYLSKQCQQNEYVFLCLDIEVAKNVFLK